MKSKKTESITRVKWIDNLKVFAAYGVLLGHCYSLFIGQNLYGQTVINPGNLFLRITGFIYNGDMWVIVFFILSGYFAANKSFFNIREFIKACVKRYFHFVVHFAMLVLFMLVIDQAIGFQVRSELVANEWAGLPMRISTTDCLKCIFIFDSRLDGPLWTMKYTFISGIMIYAANFICGILNIKDKSALYMVSAGILFILGLKNLPCLFYSCCIAGGYLRLLNFRSKWNMNTKYYVLLIGALILLVGGFQNFMVSFMPESRFSQLLEVDRKWYAVYWFLILFLMLLNFEKTEKFLGRRQFCKDTNHSFYVYILHFIILKSIIMAAFSMTVGKIGFIWSSALSTVLCLFATMVFAWLFDRGYKYLRMLYGC